MAPVKGSRKGQGKGGACQVIQTKRLMLVKSGKASWVPIRMYSVEEAFRKAGIE